MDEQQEKQEPKVVEGLENIDEATDNLLDAMKNPNYESTSNIQDKSISE